MKETGNFERGFVWSNKAWYAENNNLESDTIFFGMYDDDGCSNGEITVNWNDLGPVMKVYDDAWLVLASFTDFLSVLRMYDGDGISAQKFTELLELCGFEDMTPYTR